MIILLQSTERGFSDRMASRDLVSFGNSARSQKLIQLQAHVQTTSARKADRHVKPNKNDISDVGPDMGQLFHTCS